MPATAATLHLQLVFVQVIEIMMCCLDGVFFEATRTPDFGVARHVSYSIIVNKIYNEEKRGPILGHYQSINNKLPQAEN